MGVRTVSGVLKVPLAVPLDPFDATDYSAAIVMTKASKAVLAVAASVVACVCVPAVTERSAWSLTTSRRAAFVC